MSAGEAISTSVWDLARRQHGVVTRSQLIELGLHPQAVKHRLATGRLHPVWRGVYAVGRPELTPYGRWMAAVLSCGPHAALSHSSAAALWEIRPRRHGPIEITVPAHLARSRPGIVVHRLDASGGGPRRPQARDAAWPEPGRLVTRQRGIPVTSPALTLVDLASRLPAARLEAALNEADKRDLVDPERLRAFVDAAGSRPGAAALRRLLDRRTFVLTESELERLFLPIARRAGLPLPRTGSPVGGFRVDFHWPELGLVVETDGLRYHRTPSQQAHDRVRDQALTAAGLTTLRFTHAQVRHEPERVRATLASVGKRLGLPAGPRRRPSQPDGS